MTNELDLSLFEKDGIIWDNYQLLPKPMRVKLIKDLAFCENPDFKTLETIQNLEKEQDILESIKKILTMNTRDQRAHHHTAREKKVLSLLQCSHRTTQLQAFQYAAQNPSAVYQARMKAIVNKNREPFLMSCLARVLSASSIHSIHDLLILLKTSNPLVLKSVLECLEAQGSIYSRRVFLAILRLPIAESCVNYQLCISALHRIPTAIRSLCWAQAIAYQDNDFSIKNNLKLMRNDFPELANLMPTPEAPPETVAENNASIHMLLSCPENITKHELSAIRKMLTQIVDTKILLRAIELLQEHSDCSEWLALEPLLKHNKAEIRLAAGKALFHFKDKRIKPYFTKILKDPQVSYGEKMQWAEAGFFFLCIVDEVQAIDFLGVLLNLGPQSTTCLTTCFKQWESPSYAGMRLFLKALEDGALKPFHIPAVRSFLERNRGLINTLKCQSKIPHGILEAATTRNRENPVPKDSNPIRFNFLFTNDSLRAKWQLLLEFGKGLQNQFSLAK